jgi:hypothetical protein
MQSALKASKYKSDSAAGLVNAVSGGQPGNNDNKKASYNGHTHKGEKYLKYITGTKDQGEMFHRTTEQIAQAVGLEYGIDMQTLIEDRVEKVFIPPEKGAGTGAAEVLRAEVNEMVKEQRIYKREKGLVFAEICKRCSESLFIALQPMEKFKTLKAASDVIGLLELIEDITFTNGGTQHPYWTVYNALNRITHTTQSPTESVGHYVSKMKACNRVLEAHWGNFAPTKIVEAQVAKIKAASTSGVKEGAKKVPKRDATGATESPAAATAESDEADPFDIAMRAAREQMVAMFILANSDKQRYGELIKDCERSYLTKRDIYPATIAEAVTLMTRFQGLNAPVPTAKASRKPTQAESSYAQTGKTSAATSKKKAACKKCGARTHKTSDCTRNRLALYQDEEEHGGLF